MKCNLAQELLGIDSSLFLVLKVVNAGNEGLTHRSPRGWPMPQISTEEYERLPLRAHAFLAGVPLHDVWAIDLPRMRSGITLGEFPRAATPPLLHRRALRLGSRAAARRGGRDLQYPSHVHRSLELSGAGGHARGAVPTRVPIRKRAAPRAGQPHRPRRGAECPGRNGDGLSLLLRRVCPERRAFHARLHDSDRPVPQADRLSVAPAQRQGDVGANLRDRLTTPPAAGSPESSAIL